LVGIMPRVPDVRRPAPFVLVTMTSRDPGDLAHEVRERHLRALRAVGLVPLGVAGTAGAAEVEAVLGVCVAAYLPGTDYVPEGPEEDAAAAQASAAAAGMPWDPHKVRVDELALRAAWRRKLPTLGICGGMQAMARLAGGRLRMGEGEPGEGGTHRAVAAGHPVELTPGSLAAAAFAGAAVVEANSHHRQVLASAPEGLAITGRAADGVAEALEAPADAHPFWLGLQWHPELLEDERPYLALAAAADGGSFRLDRGDLQLPLRFRSAPP
jgi:putative glutamine amidotransferase